MANAKFLFAILLLMIIFEMNIFDQPWMPGVEAIDCGGKCAVRCGKSGRPKMCIRACNTCCQRCQCVPDGTSGNKNQCPCYADMKTHGGRPKCP